MFLDDILLHLIATLNLDHVQISNNVAWGSMWSQSDIDSREFGQVRTHSFLFVDIQCRNSLLCSLLSKFPLFSNVLLFFIHIFECKIWSIVSSVVKDKNIGRKRRRTLVPFDEEQLPSGVVCNTPYTRDEKRRNSILLSQYRSKQWFTKKDW